MPRTTTAALRIDLNKARAHWHARQGLAQPEKGTVDEIVASTGWPRTLGGVDVYLAVLARAPGMRRRDLDEAVEQSRLQVVPAVRGCIYLVPRAHVPLVLRLAEEQSRKRSERELEKVGVSTKEIAGVAEAVLAALRKGPLSTDALRKALPEGAVRSLGEKGKKVGISSTLPPALRHLEFEGKIERTLEGGRLDTERYAWRLLLASPFAGAKIPNAPVDRHAAIARVFFQSSGPATARDFAAWSGLSQRDAKAAMDRCGLAPIAVDGYADDAFALEEDLPALREPARAPSSVSMLSFEDNYIVLHGGPALLTDPKHHDRKIAVWGQTKGTTLGDAKHISMRALLDGDRLAGMWEYDPDAGEVVFGTWDPLPRARRDAALALAKDVGRFLREEIGHAKSFSLDTVDGVHERAAIVKALS
jgi:hypothetical protein